MQLGPVLARDKAFGMQGAGVTLDVPPLLPRPRLQAVVVKPRCWLLLGGRLPGHGAACKPRLRDALKGKRRGSATTQVGCRP